MKNRTFEIYETIKEHKFVTVEELAETYKVTRKTIRIDLTLLEDAKLISRTQGRLLPLCFIQGHQYRHYRFHLHQVQDPAVYKERT